MKRSESNVFCLEQRPQVAAQEGKTVLSGIGPKTEARGPQSNAADRVRNLADRIRDRRGSQDDQDESQTSR
jgi:hypothetical protein